MKKDKTVKKQKEVKDMVIVDGTVIEAFPNAMFDVQLDNGQIVRCTVAGNMRNNRFKIRVNPDDRVQLGISIYNNSVGRILYRYN
jgi:translation initiation factor IF-1